MRSLKEIGVRGFLEIVLSHALADLAYSQDCERICEKVSICHTGTATWLRPGGNTSPETKLAQSNQLASSKLAAQEVP